jgi:hydroxymethylglutaryl-CoA synthase
MVFSGVIQPEYKKIVGGMNLQEEIGPRKKLSIHEYERLRTNQGIFNTSLSGNRKEFVLVKIGGKTADKAGFREYNFIN